MRNLILASFTSLLLAACAMQGASPQPDAAAIAAAIADPARPAEDVQRDADRKPADMLVFAGAKVGDRVVDFIPGGGYFTRLFSKVVGADGKVYAAAPNNPDGSAPPVAAIASNPAYANVSLIPLAPGTFSTPEPVDIIWTAQNYHDLHLARLKIDVPLAVKGLFDALKPGGVLIIVDHVAADGSGLDVPDKLHRINMDIVKQEVTAAGFVYEDESPVLRNPADDHTKGVFDPSLRGHTDQFVFRFRKPG